MTRTARAQSSTVRGAARGTATAVAVTAQGNVTARADRLIPEGTWLRSANGSFTGRIARVFGPVSHPYLSIRPRRHLSTDEALALVGQPLVIEDVSHRE